MGGGAALWQVQAHTRTLQHAQHSHTLTHSTPACTCVSVKMWDLAMDREPVAVMPVHEGLRSYLPSLYENDSIFDKFQVSGQDLLLRQACPLPSSHAPHPPPLPTGGLLL
jgi:hypothetical protein